MRSGAQQEGLLDSYRAAGAVEVLDIVGDAESPEILELFDVHVAEDPNDRPPEGQPYVFTTEDADVASHNDWLTRYMTNPTPNGANP